MDMKIPPLRFKIMLESNPLKSRILVGGLGVLRGTGSPIRRPAKTAVLCDLAANPTRSRSRLRRALPPCRKGRDHSGHLVTIIIIIIIIIIVLSLSLLLLLVLLLLSLFVLPLLPPPPPSDAGGGEGHRAVPPFNKGFPSIQRNPLLQKEIPYYRRKSLVIGGNPLLKGGPPARSPDECGPTRAPHSRARRGTCMCTLTIHNICIYIYIYMYIYIYIYMYIYNTIYIYILRIVYVYSIIHIYIYIYIYI